MIPYLEDVIKAFIFDLGGIVVPEKGDVIKEKVSNYLGITKPELIRLEGKLKLKVENGQITLLEMYSRITRELRKEINPKSVLQKHISLYKKTSTKRYPRVLDIIRKLKREYKVVCLTNTEIEIADINRKNGLFNLFDKKYLSTEIGFSKPQLGAYKAVLNDLNLKPDEVVFIDDKQAYLEPAKKRGIKTIHYHGLKLLIEKLKKDNFIRA